MPVRNSAPANQISDPTARIKEIVRDQYITAYHTGADIIFQLDTKQLRSVRSRHVCVAVVFESHVPDYGPGRGSAIWPGLITHRKSESRWPARELISLQIQFVSALDLKERFRILPDLRGNLPRDRRIDVERAARDRQVSGIQTIPTRATWRNRWSFQGQSWSDLAAPRRIVHKIATDTGDFCHFGISRLGLKSNQVSGTEIGGVRETCLRHGRAGRNGRCVFGPQVSAS